MSTDKFSSGLAVRREVIGDKYVEAALARATDFSQPLQDLVTEYCWGSIWTRPGLSRRDRSLINLAMMVPLNRHHEFKLHVAGALRNGCTTAEITELLLQATVYAGVPAGVEAFRLAAEAIADFDAETGNENERTDADG